MAVDIQQFIFPAALWPQGDARDPLGVWGGRHSLQGDATGGSIQIRFAPPAGLAGAYVYTCYHAQISVTDTFISGTKLQLRLLTNWPDIDQTVGVQGFGTVRIVDSDGDADFAPPLTGPAFDMVAPSDRYLLLFDPRPTVGAFDIVSMQIGINTNLEQHVFECWGYYWDRQVLNTPGGPRHPGSN